MLSPRVPAPNRRALIAGAALSLAASHVAVAGPPTAPPSDPHPSMLPELLRLWREHKRTAFGWGDDAGSEENDAADAAYDALCDAVMRLAELPPPRTGEGLAAVAVGVGLIFEGCVSEDSSDLDRAFGLLITAALSALGADMPADWKGVMYQPKASAALSGEGAR